MTTPSDFKIVGFLVGTSGINVLTGEQNFAFNCRIGKPNQSVDITPFLENVKVVTA